MTTKDLEKIIYYESYVVVNPGTTGLQRKDLISEEQYFEILSTLPENNDDLELTDKRRFVAADRRGCGEEPAEAGRY